MKPSKDAIEEWEIRYSSVMYIPLIMEGKRLSRTRISIGTSIFQVYDLGLTALQHHSPAKKSGDYKNRQQIYSGVHCIIDVQKFHYCKRT